MIKWQFISGSDPASPCTLCGEPTQNHFWGCFKKDTTLKIFEEEFAMAYYFCNDACVNKLKHILECETKETKETKEIEHENI